MRYYCENHLWLEINEKEGSESLFDQNESCSLDHLAPYPCVPYSCVPYSCVPYSCVIGLSKQALSRMGQTMTLFYPTKLMGTFLAEGELLLIIESTKSAIDIEAPCTLCIEKVHSALIENPQLLDQNAEETWLVQGSLTPQEWSRFKPKLMAPAQYQELMHR